MPKEKTRKKVRYHPILKSEREERKRGGKRKSSQGSAVCLRKPGYEGKKTFIRKNEEFVLRTKPDLGHQGIRETTAGGAWRGGLRSPGLKN